MSLPNLIKLAIVAWCLIEALLFAVAVRLLGLVPVVLFQFAVGAVGLWLLKRTGAAALIKLRASFRGRGGGERAGIIDEGLAISGALALTLPGFLSDVLGAALLVPVSRARIAAWVVGRRWTRPGSAMPRAAADPAVIDLPPGEWSRTEGRRPSDLRS